MRRGFVIAAIVMGVLLSLAPVLRAQTATASGELGRRKWNNSPPMKEEYANKKPSAPAPRRDLSGFWDGTAEGGVQAKGPIEHVAMYPDHPGDDLSGEPDDTKVPHPLTYTPAGLAALKANKPGVGVRAVGPGLVNDPVDFCDPQGFPRMELYELRVIEITQTKNQVIYLDEFYDNWRAIWTDGRPLPNAEEAEPRWNGYSVGRWVDDYTFVADTVGMKESTWLDNAGRPHSSELRVQETFHRRDYDTLELSVKITDPKMYTQPWMALDKFVLHRLPDDFDMEEFFCSVSETADYNKLIGNPASAAAPQR